MRGYRVYLMNFHYHLDPRFATLGDAQRAAETTGYECVIELGGQPVANYSPYMATQSSE